MFYTINIQKPDQTDAAQIEAIDQAWVAFKGGGRGTFALGTNVQPEAARGCVGTTIWNWFWRLHADSAYNEI